MKESDNINLSFDPTFYCTDIRYDIRSIIKKLIYDSESKNISEIKRVVTNQHELIFNYDNLINSNRSYVQQLFTDSNVSITFLDTLDSIIGLISLSTEEIIFINKILYDFFECSKINKILMENEIKSRLLSISYKINSDKIREFSALIGINNANILSILSYSSFMDEKVVHRVNDFIVSNIRLSIEDLILLYNSIFNVIDDKNKNEYTGKQKDKYLTRKGQQFIIYSMLEYWNDLDKYYTEDEYNTFINISYIILYYITLLGKLSPNELYNLLKDYGNMIKLHNINNVRFSLSKAANDSKLYLLNRIINDLYIQDDIKIP